MASCSELRVLSRTIALCCQVEVVRLVLWEGFEECYEEVVGILCTCLICIDARLLLAVTIAHALRLRYVHLRANITTKT